MSLQNEAAQGDEAAQDRFEPAREDDVLALLNGDDPEAEEDACASYDKPAMRREIHQAAKRFVSEIEKKWQGAGGEFNRVMLFERYLVNIVAYAAGAFVLFGASCVVADHVKGMDESESGLGVVLGYIAHIVAISIVALAYFGKRKSLIQRLENLDHALFLEVDKYVDKKLISDMRDFVIPIPDAASRETDTANACRNLVEAFRRWRELERIPTYLKNHWYAYRIEARNGRETKAYVAHFFVFPLMVAAAAAPAFFFGQAASQAEGSALAAEIIGLPFGFMGATTVTEMKVYLWASAISAILAASFYLLVMQLRLLLVLDTINDGLRLGSRLNIGGFHKFLVRFHSKIPPYDAVVTDWREYIATKDPIPDIIQKYARLLNGYITCLRGK